LRPLVAALLAAISLLPMTLHAAPPAQPYPLVVTLDDGPSLATTPRMTPQERHEAILRALADHGATAVLYVTLNFGANHPEGMAMARRWGEAGHLLGNHTVSHPDLHADKVPLAQYLAEIDACDAAMHGVPGWRRWFRATFLNEGHTPERRDGLRRHLAARGYALSRVHLDSRDWAFAGRLQALLTDPQADDQALKAEFIAQLLERARALRDAPERPPVAVLLMHHTLLSARWLDDTLAMLHDEGFVFVHPDQASLD